MDNTIWFAIGIATGVYMTSIRFRIRINRSFNRFVAWCKDVIERNKKIHKQQEEIKKLKSITDTISSVKRIGREI